MALEIAELNYVTEKHPKSEEIRTQLAFKQKPA